MSQKNEELNEDGKMMPLATKLYIMIEHMIIKK